MNFIFDETPDRRKTNSVKWNRNAIESISANADALPFWVADMDFYPEPQRLKNWLGLAYLVTPLSLTLRRL